MVEKKMTDEEIEEKVKEMMDYKKADDETTIEEIKEEIKKVNEQTDREIAAGKFKSFNEKLIWIQTRMKAPKNLTNDYSKSKFKYRNVESIFEAAKPLLAEQNLSLILTDSIEMIGNRFYVKASATLYGENGKITVVAYAREADNKNGMDPSQLTGATSSYARKYALNGLFLLDDTKDADTNEYQEQENRGQKSQSKQYTKKQPAQPSQPTTRPIDAAQPKQECGKISAEKVEQLTNLCILAERDPNYIAKAMGANTMADIKDKDFAKVQNGLEKIVRTMSKSEE